MRDSIVSTCVARVGIRVRVRVRVRVGVGVGVGVGFRVRVRVKVRVRHGLDRRVLVLLEHPPLDVGERRDHALDTAEGGPVTLLCLPAVLDQLGQAWLGLGSG